MRLNFLSAVVLNPIFNAYSICGPEATLVHTGNRYRKVMP